MYLKQTFSKPLFEFWDGGAKDRFDWHIEGPPGTDGKGQYIRIGSWSANHWFNVSVGKTDKLTLCHAMTRLRTGAERAGHICTTDKAKFQANSHLIEPLKMCLFEYVKED